MADFYPPRPGFQGAEGIGFVPYSPINRAFLSGAINEYTRFDPENDNRPDSPRFQPEAIRANTHIVEALKAFGRTRDNETVTPYLFHVPYSC